MLARTFVFLPGIGLAREGVLWRRGVESWADYRSLARVPGIRPRTKERHDAILEVAERNQDDPAFFSRVLPPGEAWRAWGKFGERAAFVDIETTGDRANLVTVVGARFNGESRAFVKGKDYTPEAVTDFLADATMLVTFNGASFDLPVLRNEGVEFPSVPHLDLRPALARAGYTGGLKKIEETLGMARGDGLQGLTGYDAVKLWRRWESFGDEDALGKLVAYNVADFENLEPLARLAVDKLRSQTLAGITSQSRLALASR